MGMRDLGVVLAWGGALLLAVALVVRIRRGAWSIEALDLTPSPGWPTKVLAALGGAAVLVAVVLVVGSFL